LTPLIFLHGIGTGPGAWRRQADALAPSREVLTPNLVPAFGRGWAATLQEVTDLVAARGPVDLCGLSLGALAALHVAADRPHGVRRLAVCAGFATLPAGIRRGVRAMALAARFAPQRLLHRQLVDDLPEPHRSVARAEIGSLRPRRLAA